MSADAGATYAERLTGNHHAAGAPASRATGGLELHQRVFAARGMMVDRTSLGLAIAAGAASGVMVLGVVGRLAMAGLAVALDSPTNLSVRGILEVMVLGGLLGAVGGLLLLAGRRILPARPLVRSVLVALALAVGTFVVALAGGRISLAVYTVLPFTLSVVVVVFLLYALVANGLLRYLQNRD
jgi:hypothetical protein